MKHLKKIFESTNTLIKDLYSNEFKDMVTDSYDFKIEYDMTQIEVFKDFDINNDTITATIIFKPSADKVVANYEYIGEITTGYTPATYDDPAEWDTDEHVEEGKKEFDNVDAIYEWFDDMEYDIKENISGQYGVEEW